MPGWRPRSRWAAPSLTEGGCKCVAGLPRLAWAARTRWWDLMAAVISVGRPPDLDRPAPAPSPSPYPARSGLRCGLARRIRVVGGDWMVGLLGSRETLGQRRRPQRRRRRGADPLLGVFVEIPAGMAAARAREMEVFDQIWVKTCYCLLPRPAMETLSASFPS